MYSRAERVTVQGSSNAHLGPGCYENQREISRVPGYAPFSSLAPKVSFFEECVKSGPAPGSYAYGIEWTARLFC